MRNLLALLLFVPSLCLSQLPDYVPLDGLVGWYPFNGNANDESGNGNDGIVNGATLAPDRQGILNQAFDFNGDDNYIDCGYDPSLDPNEITISAWIQFDVWEHQAIIVSKRGWSGWGGSYNFKLFSLTSENGFAADWSIQGNARLTSNPEDFESLVWHHVTYSHSQSTVALYHNGILMESIASPGLLSPEVNVPLLIGEAVNGLGAFDGRIDDIGIWNRALNEAEVQALFLGAPIEYGCTDSTACNFDSLAISDDGSCEYGCLYCGEGTVWDSTLQECVTDVTFPTAPCGEGTVWDPVNEECIVAVPTDTDFDGCVSAGDILNLLATFGTCPPVPFSGPCQGLEHVAYHGHDYDIVAIGDQCWFAENLRSTAFRNGETIPTGLDTEAWTEATTPAMTHYAADDSVAYGSEDATGNQLQYGSFYNGYAVQDSRGLCPSGWTVPTDAQWMAMESFLGMDSIALTGFQYRPGVGHQISNSPSDTPPWTGNNLTGWSGTPAGARSGIFGYYFEESLVGYFWGRVDNWPGGTLPYRALGGGDAVYRANRNPRAGFSVRCIKN